MKALGNQIVHFIQSNIIAFLEVFSSSYINFRNEKIGRHSKIVLIINIRKIIENM
jgi:hypothetical protein